MAVNCEELLDADIERNCDVAPVGSLEVNVVLINREDLNYNLSVVNASNNLLLDMLICKTGKNGYLLEGIKQSNSAKEDLVIKDYVNAYKHLYAGVVVNPSVANRKSLAALVSGSKYVAVIEKLWKGAGSADAFDVLGFDVGMEGATKTWSSNENDGVEMFELASKDGYEEPFPRRTLLITDYATTKAAFDGKFAG